MPVDFLDVLLALVNEQELCRDSAAVGVLDLHALGRFLRVFFDGKIPHGNLAVGTRYGEHRVFGRMPLDRRDGIRVPRECCRRNRLADLA